MLKKLCSILIIFVIAAAFFTGCVPVKENEFVVPQNSKEQKAFIDVVDATSIKIVDVVENRYDDPLDITLTQEEFKQIKEAFYEGLDVKSTRFDSIPVYALQFLDESGKETGYLMIDNQNTIQMRNGISFYRCKDINDALSQLEEKYGIKENMYTRKPGENYFGLLSYATNGVFDEITENNFVEGTHVDLNMDQITSLKDASKDFEVKTLRSDVSSDLKFLIQIYSVDGGLVCELRVFKDGSVCTMEGYEIVSLGINGWIENIITDARENK